MDRNCSTWPPPLMESSRVVVEALVLVPLTALNTRIRKRLLARYFPVTVFCCPKLGQHEEYSHQHHDDAGFMGGRTGCGGQ